MSAPYEVVRSATARRIRLAVDPATGVARLTVPKRAALKPALAWADERRGWIAEQQARLPRPIPFRPGAILPIDGTPLTLDWQAGAPRGPNVAADRLVIGGPAEAMPGRAERWLRALARARLSEDTEFFAARAGVSIARVAIGDPRRRWGSCASDGSIRYSWRLILAPVFVRHATVAHEVAHRLHMNHSAQFHAAVAQILGSDPAPATAWLRSHGAALHWYGRE